MNSNGDQQSASARAAVPVPPAGATPEGRAAVPVGAAPSGRASVGSASVGSARVGGRASVGEGGTGGYGGRAAVARAAVRPAPGYGGFDQPGGVPPGKPPKSVLAKKAAKKRRRINIITALVAVVVILAGAGVVAGTYYYDDVQLIEPPAEDQVSQVFAADGKTQLTTLGSTTRSLVPYASINPIISQAVMAAEDKNFMDHNGIDFKGIMRAAWNNVTGGDKQGASTITQQYTRYVFEWQDVSYGRKIREAFAARRMEEKYSKEEILGRYLNSVYFGRGAYGIEAAVKAYFGQSRSSLTPPGQPKAITAAEAALLASVIKQPEPTVGGHQGYDPRRNPTAAQDRWNYTLNNMVEKGWLTAANKPTKYPKSEDFNPNACRLKCGSSKPTGNIVKYVQAELREMGISEEEENKGGLQIVTTINPKVQEAAEKAANRANEESPMSRLGKDYKTALVAIDPTTGQVLAYYGGPDGNKWDYAGPNPGGGGRPPGSSFKIYTLLAALSAGYGFDTTWDSEAKKSNGQKISNAGRGKLQCDKRRCPLDVATKESYNFPFYHLANLLGPDKIVEAAHKAGVQYIIDESEKRIDLSKASEREKKNFGNEIGFGQYPITVLDHTAGVATLANGGQANKAHFIKSVKQRNEVGKFRTISSEKLKPKQAFDPNVVAAIDHVLLKIPPRGLKDGDPAIGKTGTWQLNEGENSENGDAWMVGGTRHLVASVWIGREKIVKGKPTKLMPLFTPAGDPMYGGTTPAEVWKKFLDLANDVLDKPRLEFAPDVKISDPSKKGNGLPAPEPEQRCVLGICIGRDGISGPGNNGPGGNAGPGGPQQPGDNGDPGNTFPNDGGNTGPPGPNGQDGGGFGQGDTTDQGGGQENDDG